MRKKRLSATTQAGFMVLTLFLATASAVWACTAQPRIFSLGPQVGPVGLQITLEGQAAGAPATATQTGVPVEVRWNSLDGPKIGEGVARFDGSFAVPARIPQAEPGIYFLVVKAGDAGVVRSPFEVTGEKPVAGRDGSRIPTSASSADLWKGFSNSGQRHQQGAVAQESPGGVRSRAALGGVLVAAGLMALASGMMLNRRRPSRLSHTEDR